MGRRIPGRLLGIHVGRPAVSKEPPVKMQVESASLTALSAAGRTAPAPTMLFDIDSGGTGTGTGTARSRGKGRGRGKGTGKKSC